MADETTSTETAAATSTAAAASTEAAATTATTETAAAATTTEAAKPFELKVPEGFALDDTAKAELVAQGEAGQKALDFAARYVAQQQQAHEQQVKAWGEAIAKDPELGGQNLDATRATAQKAMVAYATPGLRELFEQTGLGDHPEMVRLFAKVGKALGEDSLAGTATAAANAPANKSLHQKLYPTMQG